MNAMTELIITITDMRKKKYPVDINLLERLASNADEYLKMSERRKLSTCTWAIEPEQYGNSWSTSCDKLFWLEADSPKENGMAFCPFCGRILKENLEEREV